MVIIFYDSSSPKKTGINKEELLSFLKSCRSKCQFDPSTYLSSIETCFRNRRFPVDIIRSGRIAFGPRPWLFYQERAFSKRAQKAFGSPLIFRKRVRFVFA